MDRARREGAWRIPAHYNPLIDEAVAAEFGLPSSWVLQAQMPFGTVAQAAAPVDKQPVDSRVKVFGL